MHKIPFLNRVILAMLPLVILCTGLIAQVNFVFNANAFGSNIRGLSAVQIVNRTSELFVGNLGIDVKNMTSNTIVVRININDISVKPGNNLIPAGKFSTANMYYESSEDGNYLRQTGAFPETELEYCFKLEVTSKNNTGDVFENCFPGSNIITSPLELTSPDNLDQFCNKRPMFSWQPPMPLKAGVSFAIKLVEIKEGQTAAEAVLNNTPLIYQSAVKGFRISYPSSVPDLKDDKSYAWQVTADNSGRQSLSEIWKFSIQCDKQKKDSGSYRELKPEDDGGFLSTGSSLRFAVYNSYVPGGLHYEISDLENPDKKFKKLPSVELQKGENNIQIDLNKIPGMQDDNEYLLLVTLPDGKKVSVRFKYDDSHE